MKVNKQTKVLMGRSRSTLRETAERSHIGRRHSNEQLTFAEATAKPLKMAVRQGDTISHNHSATSRDATNRHDIKSYWDRLMVVKFYEDDCDDCLAMGTQYEDLVPKYKDVVFLEANVIENLETASEMNIKLLPTFILFKNYVEVDRLVDTQKEKLEDLIKKYLRHE